MRIFVITVPIVVAVTITWYFANSYDFEQYSRENPLGVSARVLYDINHPVPCIKQPCKPHPTYLLQLDSEQGSEIQAFSICNKVLCTKKIFSDFQVVNVRSANPQAVSAAVNTPYVELLDFPWKVGDTVHIKVRAMPVILLDNGTLVHYPDRLMFIDLGQSTIVQKESNIPY